MSPKVQFKMSKVVKTTEQAYCLYYKILSSVPSLAAILKFPSLKKGISFNKEHILECSQHTPLQSGTYKK